MINNLMSALGLAILAWLSIFAMIWLFVFGKIPINGTNTALWTFCVFVAISASALSRGKR